MWFNQMLACISCNAISKIIKRNRKIEKTSSEATYV